MSRKEFTEQQCIAALSKQGCNFSGGGRTFTVSKNKLGLSGLAMVDYLQNHCKLFAKWE